MAPSVGRAELAAILFLLSGLGLLLVKLAWETGITVDEPAHVLSARLYWEGRDRLKPGDMPPLIKIVGGWAPKTTDLPLPAADNPAWKVGHEWHVALAMMESLTAEEIRRHFFRARLPLLIFPLGCAALLWWWGRQLFRPHWIGLAVAVVFALSPNVLGHGPLFKNDLATTFAYLLFWYRAWAYWREPSRSNTAWLGAALCLGLLAKFSLFLLAPIGPMVILAREWKERRWREGALRVGLLAAIAYAGTVCAWQFDFSPIPEEDRRVWTTDPTVPAIAAQLALTASEIVPLPARVWLGAMSLLHSNAAPQPIYFLGEVRPQGHPLYFLVAMAVKMPRATQGLMAFGLLVALWELFRRRRWTEGGRCFWLVPGLLYLVLASTSNLQFGVRLVLPAIAFLILLTGKAMEWFAGRRQVAARLAPLLLIAWLAERTANAYPHYLSFFNQWAGGPEHGLEYLSDSNVDWGQDLRLLARYVEENKIERIGVAYFGTDNLWAYLTDRVAEPVYPPWSEAQTGGRRSYQPKPGYYAISATLLTGQLFKPEYRDYFRVFRDLEPVARAGKSIYIYRIDTVKPGDPR